jgi:signal transduction histidine kinase
VAFHWRIRHKLWLGLGLVVGIITFLLAGTLYGTASLRTIMKCIDAKQAELNMAQDFKIAVSALHASGGQADARRDLRAVRAGLPDTRRALQEYEAVLATTLSLGRDPDQGDQEKGLVGKIWEKLGKLDKILGKSTSHASGMRGSGESGPIDEDVKALLDALSQDALDLSSEITSNLAQLHREAQHTFRNSLWVVFSVGGGGVVLLFAFLRFFYRWVFWPIRDLEAGAGRVAQGDFEHRIEVHSGDEMEELADAFNDMTGRLREMYRDLARQVNERSRQLVRSERLAGVGFLAAGVAHEINNPLASIAFCSEALEARLDNVLGRVPEHGEVVRKYLRMIQQEAFRCKDITQKLLEFSRGGERRREPTDLSELIQGVLDMARHLPNCKGKTIHFEPSGALVAGVNAQEVKSVVLNLVVNALDSMDEGGALEIHLGQRDGMAEIVFADSGCGMTTEVLENIFEPFFTRSRTGKGTGLGLSISHRVISQHGGEIEAASAGPGQGSTFTVRLPVRPAEGPRAEERGPKSEVRDQRPQRAGAADPAELPARRRDERKAA